MMIAHLQLLFYDISVEWEWNLFNKGNIDLCSAIFYQMPEKTKSAALQKPKYISTSCFINQICKGIKNNVKVFGGTRYSILSRCLVSIMPPAFYTSLTASQFHRTNARSHTACYLAL